MQRRLVATCESIQELGVEMRTTTKEIVSFINKEDGCSRNSKLDNSSGNSKLDTSSGNCKFDTIG